MKQQKTINKGEEVEIEGKGRHDHVLFLERFLLLKPWQLW